MRVMTLSVACFTLAVLGCGSSASDDEVTSTDAAAMGDALAAGAVDAVSSSVDAEDTGAVGASDTSNGPLDGSATLEDSGGSPSPDTSPGADVAVGADGGSSGGAVPPIVTDFDLSSVTTGLAETATRYLAGQGAQAIATNQDPAPAFGTWYTTPFNTALTPMTAQANSNHAYSQLQAFSSDNSYVLLSEDIAGTPSAETVVRRVAGFEKVWSVPVGTVGNPRWDPTSPQHLIHFNDNGEPSLAVQRTDVATGATETVFDFPSEYQSYLSNQSFDELSRDGRWIAGQAVGTGNWSRIFAVDLVNGTLGAQLDPEALYSGPCTPDPQWGQPDPDWVGVSPLGNYLVVQWGAEGTGRCEGLETYDIQSGAYIGHVTSGHPHADLTVLADGLTEVFVSAELSGPSAGQAWVNGTAAENSDLDNPALAYRLLPGPATGESEPNYLYGIDWGGFEHISCRGPIGTCVLTGYPSPGNGALDPLEDEIYMIHLDGSGVLRLAHHHSSGAEYWSQPRASVSLDGRFIIFDSDWGFPDGQTIAYLIDLAQTP